MLYELSSYILEDLAQEVGIFVATGLDDLENFN
jgi:hypothetical protein